MNKAILILGAGGHGAVVAETAAACGYSRIAFLDDANPEALGKLSEPERFAAEFADAIVAIGNNRLRGELQQRLKEAGFCLPVLVHPTAYVSPTAQIGEGTVVEPKAIVNTRAHVGRGCIISVGAIVDHDTEIGGWSHVNAGAIVKAGGTVPPFTKLEAGEVVLGYPQAVVNRESPTGQAPEMFPPAGE